VELAIYLSMLGRKVAVVEMLGEISHGGNFLHVRALEVEIKKYGIDMNYNTKALKITDRGVVCSSTGGERSLKRTRSFTRSARRRFSRSGGPVPDGAGFLPHRRLYRPEKLMNATSMAFSVARNIGRKTI
jgi:hypothetical protein